MLWGVLLSQPDMFIPTLCATITYFTDHNIANLTQPKKITIRNPSVQTWDHGEFLGSLCCVAMCYVAMTPRAVLPWQPVFCRWRRGGMTSGWLSSVLDRWTRGDRVPTASHRTTSKWAVCPEVRSLCYSSWAVDVVVLLLLVPLLF